MLKITLILVSITSTFSAFAGEPVLEQKPYNSAMLGRYVKVSANSEYCGDIAELSEQATPDSENKSPFMLSFESTMNNQPVSVNNFRYLDEVGPLKYKDDTYFEDSTTSTKFDGNTVSEKEEGWVMGIYYKGESKLVYDEAKETLTYTKVEKTYNVKTTDEKCVYLKDTTDAAL